MTNVITAGNRVKESSLFNDNGFYILHIFFFSCRHIIFFCFYFFKYMKSFWWFYFFLSLIDISLVPGNVVSEWSWNVFLIEGQNANKKSTDYPLAVVLSSSWGYNYRNDPPAHTHTHSISYMTMLTYIQLHMCIRGERDRMINKRENELWTVWDRLNK